MRNPHFAFNGTLTESVFLIKKVHILVGAVYRVPLCIRVYCFFNFKIVWLQDVYVLMILTIFVTFVANIHLNTTGEVLRLSRAGFKAPQPAQLPGAPSLLGVPKLTRGGESKKKFHQVCGSNAYYSG